MTKDEIDKLFALLGAFFPNAKQPHSKTVKAAWRLALDGYTYSALKAAAVAYATSNKFFPDLADLTELCSEPTRSNKPKTRLQMERDAQQKADTDALFAEVPL